MGVLNHPSLKMGSINHPGFIQTLSLLLLRYVILNEWHSAIITVNSASYTNKDIHYRLIH